MTGLSREIAQIYEQRRDKAVRDRDLRQAEAFRRIPALADINAEIGMLGVRAARSVLRDEASETAACMARLESAKTRRLTLLAQAGYPADWLEPRWQCPLCQDTGYTVQAEGTVTATPCACSRQLVLDKLYRSSNIAQDPDIGFDRYAERYYPLEASKQRYGVEGSVRVYMNAVRDRLLRFCETFGAEGNRSVYLYGPTGTGKTFLAKCTGKRLLDAGRTVLYLSAPALFEAARAAKFADADQPDALTAYRRIQDVNLLILDDLGTEPASDSRYADLLTLLEERERPAREPRRTLIASNMDLRQLKTAYNERVYSRIAGGFDMLPFAGDDIRMLKRREML